MTSIKPLVIDMEKETLRNEAYRQIIFRGKHSETVLMSVPPGVEIGMEIHPTSDQFIRIEQGKGTLEILNPATNLIEEYPISDGISMDIPGGTYHNVRNTGTVPLKLYFKYAPPVHSTDPDIQMRKE